MFKEFQKFIMRGNVIDLAIGLIMGAAFGAIVTSLVNDIIMPPVGLLVGGVDFTDIFILLQQGDPVGPYKTLADAQAAGAITLNIGLFINAIINFVIVAFAVFLLVRAVNNMVDRFKKKEEAVAAAAGPTTEEQLLTAINKLTEAVERKL